ncbi:hypothetical protein N9A07_01325 [Candidatus Pelagibacter ubique]|nr:hypothetical protein [Candidatus Pelagibacter ubique]
MSNEEYLVIAIATLLPNGKGFGWKKEDDNGNVIPNNQRMVYKNLIIDDNSITKPTEAEVNAKIQQIKDAETNAETKKASGKQKLKDLGLDDDEIQALIGV